ncbi:alpha-ribazole phosphatase [Thalassobellus suaedae]|uniref:Alpha-ribazole phosphatase n=1 Tax=Thalassobellus suaedae TaxID=3074124 RepID=A0ABY9Y5Q1_9FLAO|nr:alpha-ribazole phosphatase [Flavobacteriaceae bacterium HL-DH10]
MEIYLIRHTTPDIEKGICYGQSDLNLKSNFTEEFEAISNQIQTKKDFKVISSPLKRCKLLAKEFNDDILFDDRLKELNFGDWELKAWNDIPEKDSNSWMEDFVNVAVPNGESYIQLASRVYAFFEEITHSESIQNLIIISHAGPIRAILAKLLKLPLKESFNIKINYGDVFLLKRENETLKLITEITL